MLFTTMQAPDRSPPSVTSLREMLRGGRTAALIDDAELIRDAPKGEERDQEARRAIREAMLLFTMRRITCEERDRILDILSFVKVAAVPPVQNNSPNSDSDSPHLHDPFV